MAFARHAGARRLRPVSRYSSRHRKRHAGRLRSSLLPGASIALLIVISMVMALQGKSEAEPSPPLADTTQETLEAAEDLRREAAEGGSRSTERPQAADADAEPTEAKTDDAAGDDTAGADDATGSEESVVSELQDAAPAERKEEDQEKSDDGAGAGPAEDAAPAEAEPEQGDAEPGKEPESTLPGGFEPVPGCDATVLDEDSAENGKLGGRHLCDVGKGFLLRPDAAAALLALAEKYAEDTGKTLVKCIGNSYRSYEQQVELAKRKPTLSARPGTSNHGWGLAIDFECGANSYHTPFHKWLAKNGEEYGWINPDWAKANGSKPEPWHWEFHPDRLSAADATP